jgi:AcrR family transcriptional regulator
MSSAGRARGPYAKSAERQRQIIEAALEAFSTRGFHAASLRDIADQVGISQAGLMHHFTSKERLLAAVLAERDMRYEPQFRGRTHGIAVLGALRDVVIANTEQPELVRLFATLAAEAMQPEHPAHSFFVHRYRAVRDLIADAFANGQAVGEIHPSIDVDYAATVVIAIQDGLQVQWILRADFDMVRAFDDFLVGFRATLVSGTALDAKTASTTPETDHSNGFGKHGRTRSNRSKVVR